MSNKLFCLICLALVLALSGFAQAEILLNPDFEAGLDFWKTWGSGSGSGAGGWFFSSAYGATVIEDGTAQSGNAYIEIGFTPPAEPWWGYCYAFQEHPVTEGKIYQSSAWLRDGDADGTPSLIPEGVTLTWEWRAEAPTEGPDGGRSDLLDVDGDGTGGNSDKIHHRFDLTEEWTYFSTTEIAPPGAKGVTIIFGTPAAFINIDIDNASFVELGEKAREPSPADGSFLYQTWATLSWEPGNFAVSHDVYLGENFDEVNDGAEGTFQGNQARADFTVGFPGFAYPDGLVPGTTYYWRIDEVNEADPNSPWKGDVWSFSIPSKTAYLPVPADSAESVTVNVQLSWKEGFDAKLHTVYFGDNFDEVQNATGGQAQGITTFTPDTLKMAKTYYWRVDEFDIVETHKGDVWSFTTEGAVSSPEPSNGAVDVPQTTTLNWTAGALADTHEVYFGADASSLELKSSGNLGSESYDPGQLEWDTTYYWRIDEANNANADSPWTGPLWSFTTANFLIIDDMESYNDIEEGQPGSNRIYLAWADGYDNPAINGSVVGNDPPPIAEQTIVHGGLQSMPMAYDNAVGKSEATLTLTDTRDWTVNGVDTLTIWFRGVSANAAEPLYVALNDSAVVTNDNPDAALATRWIQWNIDLQAFADQGVNLANVNTITLGLGNRNNPVAGGAGIMYFDDIRLYAP
jgi:hypothetical protein